MVHARQEVRVGPLPDSEELMRYNEVVPGAAERIIRMAEKQQDFAHGIGRGDLRVKAAGVVSGFLLGGAGIGVAYYMIHLQQSGVQYVIYSIAFVISVALGGRIYLAGKRNGNGQ